MVGAVFDFLEAFEYEVSLEVLMEFTDIMSHVFLIVAQRCRLAGEAKVVSARSNRPGSDKSINIPR